MTKSKFSQIPKIKVTDPRSLQRAIDVMARNLNIMTGSSPDSVVTQRSYTGIDDRFNKLSSTVNDLSLTSPGNSNAQRPQLPTGFIGSASLSNVVLNWDEPGYKGHAYTVVLFNQDDVLGEAKVIGTASFPIFIHPVNYLSSGYYWIKHVNNKGAVGPVNASAGLYVEAQQSPQELLALLSNEIANDTFVSDTLLSRISVLDSTVIGEHFGLVNANLALQAADKEKSQQLTQLNTKIDDASLFAQSERASIVLKVDKIQTDIDTARATIDTKIEEAQQSVIDVQFALDNKINGVESASLLARQALDEKIEGVESAALQARQVISDQISSADAAALLARQALDAKINDSTTVSLLARQALTAKIEDVESAALQARQVISEQISSADAAALLARQALDAKIDGVESEALQARGVLAVKIDKADNALFNAETGLLIASDKINTSLNELDDYIKGSGGLDARVLNLSQVQANLVNNISVLQTSSDDLTSRVGVVETASDQAASRLNSVEIKQGDHSSKIAVLDTARLDLAESIRLLTVKDGELGSKISTVETATIENAQRVSDLATTAGTLTSRITSVETVNSSQASTLNSLSVEQGSLQARMLTQETASTDAVESLRLLGIKDGELSSQISTVETATIENAQRVSDLTTTAGALTSRITSVETVNSSQASTLSSLSVEQGSLQARMLTQETASTDAVESLRLLGIKDGELSSQISTVETATIENAQRVSDLATTTGTLTSRITSVESVNSSQASTLSSLSVEQGSLQARMLTQETASTDAVESLRLLGIKDGELSSQISTVETATIENAQRVSDLATTTGTLTSRITSVESVNSSQASTLSSLSVEQGSLQARMLTQETASTDAVESLRLLGIKDGELSSQISTVETATIENAQRVSDLATTAGNLTSRITSVEQTTASSSQKIAQLETVQGDNSSKITNLQQTTATSAQEITQLKATDAAVTADISSIKSVNNTQAQQLNSISTLQDTHQSQISVLQTTTANQASVSESLTYSNNNAGDKVVCVRAADFSDSATGEHALVSNRTLDTDEGVEAQGINIWVYSRKAIKVRTDRAYKVRVKVKQLVNSDNGKSLVYAGVAPLYENMSLVPRPSDGAGELLYCAVSRYNLTADKDWQIFEGTISDVGLSANNFRPGTVYVRPMLIVNYQSSGNPKALIDSLEIWDVTEELALNGKIDARYDELKQVSDTSVSHLQNLQLSTDTNRTLVTTQKQVTDGHASQLNTLEVEQGSLQARMLTQETASTDAVESLRLLGIKDGELSSQISTVETATIENAQRVSDLTTTTGTLTSRITSVESVNSNQASTLSSLSVEQGSLQARMLTQETASTDAVESLRLLGIKDGELSSQISTVETATIENAQRVSDLATTAGTLTSRITSVESVNSNQASTLSSLSVEQDSLQARMLTQETASTDAVESLRLLGIKDGELSSQISTVETATIENAQRVSDLATTAGNLTSRITSVESVNSSQASKLGSLEVAQGSLQARMLTQETASTDAVESLGLLGIKDGELSSQISTVETATLENAQRVSDLATTTGNLTSRITSVEQTTANSSQKIAQLETVQGDNSSKITNLQQTTATSAQEITQLKATDAAVTADISSIKSVNNTQAQQLNSITTQQNTHQSQISVLQTTTANQASVSESLTYSNNNAGDKVVCVRAADFTDATSGEHAPVSTHVFDTDEGVEARATNIWVYSRKVIKVRTDRVYKVRFKVKQLVNGDNGVSRVYAGVVPLRENMSIAPMQSGGAGKYLYFGVSSYNLTVAEGWKTFEGTISGIGLGANNFRPDTVYVRPMLIVNYQSSGSPVALIDSLEIWDVTEEQALDGKIDARYDELKQVSDTSVSHLQSLQLSTDTNRSLVTTQKQVTDGHATLISTLQSVQGANSAKIVTLQNTTSTHSQTLQQLAVSIDNKTAAVETSAKAYADDLTGALKAEKVIKVDANGVVAGFGVLADSNTGSTIYLSADKVAIVPPNWNPSETSKRLLPFVYSAEYGRVVMDKASIVDLTADKITGGNLTVDNFTTTQGFQVAPGSIKRWMLEADFKDGLVRIDPTAEKLGGGSIVSVKYKDYTRQAFTAIVKSGGQRVPIAYHFMSPKVKHPGKITIRVSLWISEYDSDYTRLWIKQAKLNSDKSITLVHQPNQDDVIVLDSASDGAGYQQFSYDDDYHWDGATEGMLYRTLIQIETILISGEIGNLLDDLVWGVSTDEPVRSSGGVIADIHWRNVVGAPLLAEKNKANVFTADQIVPNLHLNSGGKVFSKHNNSYILGDHGNGNVTVNAAGGNLLVGYVNTVRVDVYSEAKFLQSVSFNKDALFSENVHIDCGSRTIGSVGKDKALLTTDYLKANAGITIFSGTSALGIDSNEFVTNAPEFHFVGNDKFTFQTPVHFTGNTKHNGYFETASIQTRMSTPHGYIDFGPRNTSHAHIYTDRPSFYFNRELRVSGGLVWHSGNDGSGSGLDADLIGGVSHSQIPKLNNDNIFSGKNQINTTGTALILGGSGLQDSSNVSLYLGNTESTGFGYYITYGGIGGGNTNYFEISSTNTAGEVGGKILLKSNQDGILHFPQLGAQISNNLIWHAGNDGSGSGLDADRLDGLDSLQFLRSDIDDQTTGRFTIQHSLSNAELAGVAPSNAGQFRIKSGNNGMSIGLDSAHNSRTAWVQVGHNSNTYPSSSIQGTLALNPHGGNVSINGHTAWHAGNDDDLGKLSSTQTWYGVNTFSNTTAINSALTVNGHVLLNGTDTWLRTKDSTGLLFSTFGGGLHMTDSTYVRVYNSKAFRVSNTRTLDAIYSTGGIRSDSKFFSNNPTGEGGLVGAYATIGNSVDQMIWTIGTSWATHSTHYGIGYHNGSEINGGNEHQVVFKNNGETGARIGLTGHAWFKKSLNAQTLRENGINIADKYLSVGDLSYDSPQTWAAAFSAVDEFKKWVTSGDADTSGYATITDSIATGFVNSIIGQFNTVVANNANVGYLTARSIEVTGRQKLINNVSGSGHVDGWFKSSNHHFTDEVTALDDSLISNLFTVNGTKVKTLRVENSGNMAYGHAPVEIDHNAIYEVSVLVYAGGSAKAGRRYVGLKASSTKDKVDSVERPLDVYRPDTRQKIASNGNFYFWDGDDWGQLIEVRGYVVGANRSVDEVPATNRNIAKLDADTRYLWLRVLNWANSGTNTVMHVYNPSIREVNTGKIVAHNIEANAVNTSHLNADSVTSSKIKSASILAGHIQSGAVTTEKLSADSVTADKIAVDSITSNKIAANAITTRELDVESVNAINLNANAVTTVKLAADAVTTAKLAAGAVTASKINVSAENVFPDFNMVDDGFYQPANAGSNFYFATTGYEHFGSRRMRIPTLSNQANNIRTQWMTVEAGETYHLAMGAFVEAAGGATLSVYYQTGILDNTGAITANGGAVLIDTVDSTSYKNRLTSTFTVPNTARRARLIFVANTFASTIITSVGGITLRKKFGGELIVDGSITSNTLAADSVTAVQIMAGAVSTQHLTANAITTSELAANSVNASKIVAGTITADRLAANSITAGQIAANAITASELAADSVTAAKIVARSITGDRLAVNSITATEIAAGTITGDKIAANAITTESLNVLAKDMVNNYSNTNTLEGWAIYGSYSASELTNELTIRGQAVISHKLTTSGDARVQSTRTAIDHNAIYETSITMYSDHPDSTGTRYFGMHAYAATEGSAINSEVYSGLTRAYDRSSNNIYFWAGDLFGGNYKTVKAYIIGCNVDPKDVPATDYPIVKLTPATKYIVIRYLSYANGGTSVTNYFFNPSIVKTGGGKISASQIAANSITADKLVAGSISVNDLTWATGGFGKTVSVEDTIYRAQLYVTPGNSGGLGIYVESNYTTPAAVFKSSTVNAVDTTRILNFGGTAIRVSAGFRGYGVGGETTTSGHGINITTYGGLPLYAQNYSWSDGDKEAMAAVFSGVVVANGHLEVRGDQRNHGATLIHASNGAVQRFDSRDSGSEAILHMYGINTSGVNTAGRLAMYGGNAYSYIEGQNTAIRLRTSYGYVNIGPSNSSYCHFYTDRSYFHFNKQVDVSGDVTFFYSDARLKTVKAHLDPARSLANILCWKPVRYIGNDTANENGFDTEDMQIGLLAQDIEKDYPELTPLAPFDTGEKGQSKSGENYKTLKYERTVAVLVSALQGEVKARQSLEKKFAELERKLEVILRNVA